MSIYVSVYMYVYITYEYVYVYKYVYMYICIYTYVYIYICKVWKTSQECQSSSTHQWVVAEGRTRKPFHPVDPIHDGGFFDMSDSRIQPISNSSMHTYIYIYMYIHMYCSYINISIPIYIHPYIDVYIYIHYIYMHVFSGNYIKRIKPSNLVTDF